MDGETIYALGYIFILIYVFGPGIYFIRRRRDSTKYVASSDTPFYSGNALARLVTVFLAAIILVQIVAVVADFDWVNHISRTNARPNYSELSILELSALLTVTDEGLEQRAAIANRRNTILIIRLALVFVTASVFFLWVYRAYKNLLVLGARELAYSPKWAVVGWIFPITVFLLPRKIMKEIWEVSDHYNSPLVDWWWWLFILSEFGFNYLPNPGLLLSSWLALIANALNIPAAILAITMVRRITAGQRAKYRIL